MNYLAHAYPYLNDPYMVAGTNLPDWLNVVDRKVRVRTKQAEPLVADRDPATARTAAGIVQHHWDDQWFHTTSEFQTLNMRFSVEIRELMQESAGLRAGFLGHILVEILLDWRLAEEHPGLLDEYYQTIAQICPDHVQRTVNRISKNTTQRLSLLIPRMTEERFLYDYADDKKLLLRLNQVMRRVKLPELSDDLLAFFPKARSQVDAVWRQLLTPPDQVAPQDSAHHTSRP